MKSFFAAIILAFCNLIAASQEVPDVYIAASISEEMKKAGKPCEVKIYPSRGTTPMEGHTFIDDSDTWGPDVFPWLDALVKKKYASY